MDETLIFLGHASSFTDEDGIRLRGRGLWPALSELDGAEPALISYESSILRNRTDLCHIRIAGVKYRERAARMTSSGGPGEELLITPEPTNPKNPAALAIRTCERRFHLGYVHDIDIPQVHVALSRGWLLISAWEWRYDDSQRCAMHALFLPPARIVEFVAEAKRSRRRR